MKIDYTKKQALFLKASKPLVDELLSLNTNNRNLRKRHINWLVDTIKNDEYMVTGQPIIVTSDNVLIDGQHRLVAIQKADYPAVDIMIVTGIDPKAQMYLDQHAKRSLKDALKLTFSKEITRGFSPLVSFLLNYTDSKDGFEFAHDRPLLKEFHEYSEKHEKQLNNILEACGRGVRTSVVAGIYVFGIKSGWDDAIRFALQVRDGESITRKDPSYLLRDFLRRNTHGGSQASQEAFRMTVGACVAFAHDKKLDRLRPLNSWNTLPK